MQFLYKLYQSISSCTIWYCLPIDIINYTAAAEGTIDSLERYGYVRYNHFYNNNNKDSNIYNGTVGTWPEYINTNKIKYRNYHNTTLHFITSS